jgi:hypothetical protein
MSLPRASPGSARDYIRVILETKEERLQQEVEHRMSPMAERLHEAMNKHDLEAFLEFFHLDYQSEQPAHPNRGFGGKERVRKNWSSIFESFPDFRAELLRHTTDGDTVWGEWHFSGRGLNMRG